MFDFDNASALLQIILFDLLLSGDNAVVIGMASRRLSPENRRRAIIIGGVGAVGLRIFFTLIVSILLDIPLLQATGGVLLFWVAYKLLRPQDHEGHVSEANSLAQAIRTIVIADVVMSLDNILAISSAAHGNRWLILFGLALSIPLLLVGSNVVSQLLGRLPILVYVGAVLLVWAAVRMLKEDKIIHDLYAASHLVELGITAVASVLILGLARWTARSAAGASPGAHRPVEVAGPRAEA